MENKQKNISITELAKLLGISRVAVFNKIKKGQIPAEKVGKVYVIPFAKVADIVQKADTGVLTEEKKKDLNVAVDRVVKEYGETLRLLGQE